MSIGVNGISKLSANSFDEINISQESEYDYNVLVIGDNVGTCNDKFIKELREMSTNEDKIIAIINIFLNNFKINGISNLIELDYKEGKWIVVYGNNSTKVLRLKLFSKEFMDTMNNIKNKYLNDRYSFCWNNLNKVFRLSTSENYSRYDIECIDCCECKIEEGCDYSVNNRRCQEYVQLDLKLGIDGKVKKFEYEFIKEFLYYKFDLIGEEVKIINLYNNKEYDCRYRNYLIKCGDFELTFPHSDELMFMFSIVDDYNNEVEKINKDVKKRQLKMDGF